MDKKALLPATIMKAIQKRLLQQPSKLLKSQGIDQAGAAKRLAEQASRRFSLRDAATPGLDSNTGGASMLARIAQLRNKAQGGKAIGPAMPMGDANKALPGNASPVSQIGATAKSLDVAGAKGRLGQNADPRVKKLFERLMADRESTQAMKHLSGPGKAPARLPGPAAPAPQKALPAPAAPSMQKALPAPKPIVGAEHIPANTSLASQIGAATAKPNIIDAKTSPRRVGVPEKSWSQHVNQSLHGNPTGPVPAPRGMPNAPASAAATSKGSGLPGLGIFGAGAATGAMGQNQMDRPAPQPPVNPASLRPPGYNTWR